MFITIFTSSLKPVQTLLTDLGAIRSSTITSSQYYNLSHQQDDGFYVRAFNSTYTSGIQFDIGSIEDSMIDKNSDIFFISKPAMFALTKTGSFNNNKETINKFVGEYIPPEHREIGKCIYDGYISKQIAIKQAKTPEQLNAEIAQAFDNQARKARVDVPQEKAKIVDIIRNIAKIFQPKSSSAGK